MSEKKKNDWVDNMLQYGMPFDDLEPIQTILGLIGWFVIFCIIFGCC